LELDTLLVTGGHCLDATRDRRGPQLLERLKFPDLSQVGRVTKGATIKLFVQA
jgi:hypothetical protein